MESQPGLSPRNLTCPVCLRKLRRCRRVGKPDKCEHWFCFPCIHEWSKNVNTCPVDRIKFNSIELFSEANGRLIEKVYIPDCSLFESTSEANDITYCEVCNQCNREDRLLLCDGCDKGYHLECITPPLDDVPTGNWYCIECIPIINSQYVDHFSESEQDLSLSLDTIPTSASDSDVIMRMGHRNDYGSGSEVIITGIEQIQESDSDVTVIGMRHLRQHDRRKMAIMIEESTSELSVTGESSDEEILAMKLRRTLQREANRASRIPLIRESSTTSSTCSSGSKFDLDESTTVLVTRESEHDNSFIDVVGDTDGEGSNDDDFIEIDSVLCGSVADNDPLSGAHTRSSTQGMSDRKVDRHSRHTVSGKMASHDVCKTDSNTRTKLKWGHSVQSPRSSRNKDDQPSLSRSSSYSKRRLVFDSEKSTKHRLENLPNRESKGHKLRNREAGRFDCGADKVSDRGKEAVSKNRRELASKKRLHHHRGAEEDNTHSTSSLEFDIKPVSLELKTNVKKRKSNPLSILNDDDSSCQSGYVDESPPTDVGLRSVSTNQNQTHTTVQCKQNRVAANVDRPQKEAGMSSSYREDILVQRKDHKGANRDNPALDKSCKSSSRIEDSRTRVSQCSIIPRRKKCRRVVLNPPKRQSSRRRSPPRSKQRKRKGFNRRKRRNTRSTILNRRRSNDSNYYPPRNMSMDGPSRPEWTPRTTRALARTAATHHSAMREAVRASYRYDSQEVGLKYAREILAQQRQVTPWKSTLSFTPSQSCLEDGANTPLSGFSDRTLTPSVGASCSPLTSETPKRLRNERREHLDQYKGSPGSLSLFLRREVRVSRAQRKSARNSSSESSNQPRNDYYGWSDDTSPLSVSHSINSRVFQDRVVSINDQEERESYGRESPTRRIVHVDSKKRHLSEVLVTPVKVRIRENPIVESDNEGGETDLLSQLCQNLNDLQNKRNVIQRDGSIVPLRGDEPTDPFNHEYTNFDEHSTAEHTPCSNIHSAPADSTTSENHIHLQNQHKEDYQVYHTLQNHRGQSQETNSYFNPQLHLEQEMSLSHDFNESSIYDPAAQSLQSQLMTPTDSSTNNSIGNADISFSDPEQVVKYCLDTFYKDGKINGRQYKRIFERSTRKVMKGTQVVGRIDIDRVMKLVKDFVDAYTTTVPTRTAM